MPRRSRLSLPGIPWHIIQRGNNRSACFFAEDDYRFYLDRLTELSKKFGAAVHAYVLMTNHVHLLLTPERADSAALTMKHLGQRYVQYINRTYKRSGTLWEGRFRSCLAQSEDYVLACYRYIELNPVRAGIVRHPREYRWSSYRANAEAKVDDLVSAHKQYLRLGRDLRERREAYRALFKAHLDDTLVTQIRAATNGNYALGNQRFQLDIERALGRRATKGKAGRPRTQAQHPSEQLGLL
ncbi:MAG: transposase [Pseudomonadota bacterium]|nr:transposase [Pseudomonadota bacterium]